MVLLWMLELATDIKSFAKKNTFLGSAYFQRKLKIKFCSITILSLYYVWFENLKAGFLLDVHKLVTISHVVCDYMLQIFQRFKGPKRKLNSLIFSAKRL